MCCDGDHFIGVIFFRDTNNLMLLGLILLCVEDALIKNYVSSKIGCIGQFVVVGGDALKCYNIFYLKIIVMLKIDDNGH